MKVTLAQIQVFAAVCDSLHFTRAAEELGISQPTVSKEIRALEEALGVRLLERSSRGVTLTAAGRALRPNSRAVLEQAQLLEAAAASVKQDTRRRVTIAASCGLGDRLLPETLRRVDGRQLGVSVELLELETGEVVDAVDSGRADIGIGHHLRKPVRATKRRLGQDELRVIINRSLVRRGERVDLRLLADVPLLMWPRDRNPAYYDAVLRACRRRGLEPLVLTGTSRISGSWASFLVDARAFALAPDDHAAYAAHDDLVSLSLDPPAYVPLEAAWRQDSADVGEILGIVWRLASDRPAPGG